MWGVGDELWTCQGHDLACVRRKAAVGVGRASGLDGSNNKPNAKPTLQKQPHTIYIATEQREWLVELFGLANHAFATQLKLLFTMPARQSRNPPCTIS